MRFWSIPKLNEIGIKRLTELGVSDPVYYFGWGEIAQLERELLSLQRNLAAIDFDAEIKAEWLSHLIYCFELLILTAPTDSTPVFGIG
jgi:hypothetical protein